MVDAVAMARQAAAQAVATAQAAAAMGVAEAEAAAATSSAAAEAAAALTTAQAQAAYQLTYTILKQNLPELVPALIALSIAGITEGVAAYVKELLTWEVIENTTNQENKAACQRVEDIWEKCQTEISSLSGDSLYKTPKALREVYKSYHPAGPTASKVDQAASKSLLQMVADGLPKRKMNG